jgi:hypothetical protein
MNEPIIDERAQAALGRHLVASLMTAGLMTGLLIFALKIFYTPVSAFAGGCKSAEECKKGEECIEGGVRAAVLRRWRALYDELRLSCTEHVRGRAGL